MEVIDLGVRKYQEVLALQKELVEKRAQGLIGDTLILVEHEPVFTLGRAGQTSNQSEASDSQHEEKAIKVGIKVGMLRSVPVVEVERGGKMTFHGPGQLVGYPIFLLTHRDLKRYLRDLEHILMDSLNENALLAAKPCPESLLLEPGQLQTGVWIKDRKIASIGIAVRKWVSYHGFALNIATDTRYFEAIEPCGFNARVMTTVENELNQLGSNRAAAINSKSLMQNFKRDLIERFSKLSASYANANESVATSNDLLTDASPLNNL